MFVITGASGKVGGQVARSLLERKLPVRVVLRDAAKAATWAAQGCETAFASMHDAPALGQAFADAEAVFVLLPPAFNPSPGFEESRANIAALVTALRQARPGRVVALSTVGAHAVQENLLTQLQMMERAFAELPMPVTFLRAAWFMENSAWDIEGAYSLGLMPSFLQPLDKPVPMVATADVASAVARLLQENWSGRRVVELEGPTPISPLQLAATLGRVLGREVTAQPVPRATWEHLFRSQGMTNPMPRMRMLDGFNEGWIAFESETLRGTTTLDTVLHALVKALPKAA